MVMVLTTVEPNARAQASRGISLSAFLATLTSSSTIFAGALLVFASLIRRPSLNNV